MDGCGGSDLSESRLGAGENADEKRKKNGTHMGPILS